ncbi:metallophosphoesterase [Actinopolymorpha sp. B9G3]|uniref:metallophosphoesterase family protein n=1 Tax=Actinopolymorpha sp. B9G3 TaxID=3158970 RepID=UPI0032D8C690
MPDHPVSDLRRRAIAVAGALWQFTRHLRRFAGRVVPRLRRPAMIVVLAVVAYAGAWFGIAFFGATQQPVGPVETTMRLIPSWRGESVLSLPPLGTLELDTHNGPVQLQVSVDRINQEAAERILADPKVLSKIEPVIIRDLREGVYATATKALVIGTLSAMLVTLIVARRRTPTIIAGGSMAVTILAVFGLASMTVDPRAVTEPKYTGLLTGAPSLIGNARDIAENFDAYADELTRLVTNVTKLYDVTSTLPAYEPEDDVIRVLHVADLHLGEHAWDIIDSVTRQYSVDVIVDSGDITDHGLPAENYFLQRIPSLRVPYVWVRGNHDSVETEEAMRQLPNVIVMDGKVKTVEGIRFLGAGDPRFTPDRDGRDIAGETEAVARQAAAIANVAKKSEPAVDAIVYHDSAGAAFFDGHASLLLTGHGHERLNLVLPGGSRLMQEGTTGGAGLRALEKDKPAPIELSVLYLDRSTRQLQAWDEITLGGLGLTSAKIDRHQVQPDEEATTPSPIPRPSGPVPTSPVPTPTITRLPEEESSPSDSPSPSAPSSPGAGSTGTPDSGETEPESPAAPR